MTANLAIAISLWIGLSLLSIARYPLKRSEVVAPLFKLTGMMLALSVIGGLIASAGLKEVYSFRVLSPLAQYPLVVAAVLLTYIAYWRLRIRP